MENVSNFERVYLQANEQERAMGFHWYIDNNRYLIDMASFFNVEAKIVIGMTAVLSPGMAWQANVNLVYNMLKFKCKMSQIKSSAYKPNIEKAIKIYRKKQVFPYLRGPKVTEFYYNLLNPFDSSHVTIDSFMIACKFEAQNLEFLKKYTSEKHIETFKTEIFELSRKYEVLPCQFQAIVWIAYHRIVKSFTSYSGQLQLKIF